MDGCAQGPSVLRLSLTPPPPRPHLAAEPCEVTHISPSPGYSSLRYLPGSSLGEDSDFLSTHLSHLVPRRLNFICAKHFLSNSSKAME